MSILNRSRQNFPEINIDDGSGAQSNNILENIVVEESFSTKERSQAKPTSAETGSFLIIWEPSISNGVVEIPYRQIFKKILEENNFNIFNETIDRFWGKDLFKFTLNDWELFRNNQMLAYLPISSGKYILLERFEIPRSLIVVQRITQTTRYVNIINENFPRFSMTIRVVVFGDIHKMVFEFFNSVIELLGKNYPGRLYIYDILSNEKIQISSSFLYRDAIENKRYYRVIPTNVVMSRNSNENTTALIEVSGLITEISGYYDIAEPSALSEDVSVISGTKKVGI